MSEAPKKSYEIVTSKKFDKDFEKAKKQQKDFSEFKKIIQFLEVGKALPVKYKDHKLKGDYKDYRECHIKPDWLLIYRYSDNDLILYRLGSHSELFQ